MRKGRREALPLRRPLRRPTAPRRPPGFGQRAFARDADIQELMVAQIFELAALARPCAPKHERADEVCKELRKVGHDRVSV
jgi:hypothetical protein